jgi:hypothetical protein
MAVKFNPEVLQSMFDRLSAGEVVTMGDDALDQMPYSLSDKAKDHWFRHCRSIPNPERVGTQDTYCVSMLEFSPTATEGENHAV